MGDGENPQAGRTPSLAAGESPAASGVYTGPPERRCVVCQVKEGIYRCARCLRRTCSLGCYKAHEKRPREHRDVFHSSSPSSPAPPPPPPAASPASPSARPEGDNSAGGSSAPQAEPATASVERLNVGAAATQSSTAPTGESDLRASPPSGAHAAPSSLSASSLASSGGCPLVRSRVDFVALRDFDENFLLRDFRLVEEAARVVEAAARHWRCEAEECAQRNRKRRSVHPQHLRALCVSRGIRFLFCPPNFSRRKSNTTRVVQRQRAKPTPPLAPEAREAKLGEAQKADQASAQAPKAETETALLAQQEATNLSEHVSEERETHAATRGGVDKTGEEGAVGEEGGAREQGGAREEEGDEHEMREARGTLGDGSDREGDAAAKRAPVSVASDSASETLAKPANSSHAKKDENSAIEWRVVFHFRELAIHRVLPAVHEDLPIYQVLAQLLDMERTREAPGERKGELAKETEGEDGDPNEAPSTAGEKRKKRESTQEAVNQGKKRRTDTGFQDETEMTKASSSLASHLARQEELLLLLPCVGSSCLRSSSSSPMSCASSSPPSSPSSSSRSLIIPARKCDRGWSLREALTGTVVVEFPEFFVALPEELASFHCVQKAAAPPPPLFSPESPRSSGGSVGLAVSHSPSEAASPFGSAVDEFAPNAAGGVAGGHPGANEEAEEEEEEEEEEEDSEEDEEVVSHLQSLFPASFSTIFTENTPVPRLSDPSAVPSVSSHSPFDRTNRDGSRVSSSYGGRRGRRDRGSRATGNRGHHPGQKRRGSCGSSNSPSSFSSVATFSCHPASDSPPYPGAHPPPPGVHAAFSGVHTPGPKGGAAASASGQACFRGEQPGRVSVRQEGKHFSPQANPASRGQHRGGGRGKQGRGSWRGGRGFRRG
ncbi:putative HIT zinc finger domain-containing protein [Neospora caninum Liverpool]|uniref:HIT zinc finger domain-containing protein,putative n=1 Tax=Neospora caninum (strain Liverpool) TaxID=572307 RepID=F0V950_NEOCL|nr:putative HIT zinc finger domain-containing protein [Neospora caninum Liverpool]CBZ50275.1 putative HIT zinc finger domain-containing protein [Neospora caninum Liverpool]CEL64880.1 TPA: HIT zinc finger domain-containing protein,putative [Neospora caninum Liverpool]|eukprot:XP_003880309.1 putative HIT zinc finger domain-containing protein [Neospora caninum Liverpool]